MAERSKAPDSRVKHLSLTGVFWSTYVGVGSNPTSDNFFSFTKILMIRISGIAFRDDVKCKEKVKMTDKL